MNPADLPLDERLRYLEASVAVQEQELVAIRAERIEADRLEQSVNRLGDGASALGEALLAVDRTQQRLTRLGQEVEHVASKAATKDEVAEEKRASIRALQAQRKEYATKLVSVGILFGVALLVAALVTANVISDNRRASRAAQVRACQGANTTVEAVNSFLDAVAQAATVPEIRERANKVKATLALQDCRRIGR